MANETSGNLPAGHYGPVRPMPEWPRLAHDLDVDVCVVGAGLAGLSVAREAARRGAEVAIIEAHAPAWNASSRNCGIVFPGCGVEARELVARVGVDQAREIWSLASGGARHVRDIITTTAMPGVEIMPGALQVATEDAGDALVERMQALTEFGAMVEGWQVERVRDVLKSKHFFHALHWPDAFSIHAANYAAGLAAEIGRYGVRVFADTPVVKIDPTGIRKRVATPSGRLRATHIVLAGSVHLGSLQRRLTETLAPVWRHAIVTAPLGDRLESAMTYQGAVTGDDGVERFRIVDGDRLMWSHRLTTWDLKPAFLAGAAQRRIRKVFPQLGKVAIEHAWSGVVGRTIHGMPQIGQLRPGLWLASGFGDHGIAMTAVAAELISEGIMERDDRWRLFEPFELVWAGGWGGRVVGQVMVEAARSRRAAKGSLARFRERARIREREREARLAAANALDRS